MEWTADRLLEMARGYQAAAVLGAAADLNLFDALGAGPVSADDLSRQLGCDARGLTILLDALTALQLVLKHNDRYLLPPEAEPFLTRMGSQTIAGMARHQANCSRRWVQLARVVKTGQPAEREPSVQGAAGDLEAFIQAMNDVSSPVADEVIQAIQPLEFTRLVDIGGGSGTWTLAFLRACPSGTVALFDVPEVLPLAKRRVAAAGMLQRVELVPGDYLSTPFPPGADLMWASAVVHQNSREENRRLFRLAFQSLRPGGRMAVRDVLMDETRTRPVAGALFAVNMLVGTPRGGTFTFDELRDDLASAGFVKTTLARRDAGMNSVVVSEKPRGGR